MPRTHGSASPYSNTGRPGYHTPEDGYEPPESGQRYSPGPQYDNELHGDGLDDQGAEPGDQDYDPVEQESRQSSIESIEDLPDESQVALKIFAEQCVERMMHNVVYPALQEQSTAIAQQGERLNAQRTQLDRLESLIRQLIPAPQGPEQRETSQQASSSRSLTPRPNQTTAAPIRQPVPFTPGPVTSTPRPFAPRPSGVTRPPANMDRPAFRVPANHRRYSVYPAQTGVSPVRESAANATSVSGGAPTSQPEQSGMRPLRMTSPLRPTGPAPRDVNAGPVPNVDVRPPSAANSVPSRAGSHRTVRAAGYPIGAQPIDSVSRMIIRELQEHLNDDPEPRKNAAIGGMKLGAPPEYNGETKSMEFEAWVTGMLRHFRIAGILGPTHDRTRVDLVGYACKGTAETWFNREVEMQERGPAAWTTLEVFQGLQRRFITQRSAAEAGREFRRLKQKDMDVHEYYHELCALARQLPDYPSGYEFNIRFMAGLKPEVANKVTDFSVTAESHTTAEVLQAAEDAEAALAVRRREEPSAVVQRPRRQRVRYAVAPKVTVNAAAAAAEPDKSREHRTRPTREDGSGPSRQETGRRCYNCGRDGHIARDCRSPVVAGKAVAIHVDGSEDESDGRSDTGAGVPAAQMSSAEEDSGEDGEAVSGTSSGDSVFDDFDHKYPISARACSIVPLDPEVPGCAVTKTTPEGKEIYAPGARRKPVRDADKQPARIPEEQLPIVGFYRIGGVLAHVMFDSGSGTNMISADFVRVAKLRPIRLERPVGLQLVLRGSRGQLNFGVNAPLELGPVPINTYFDVAGIDKYDAILGTPFLRQNRAMLDFSDPGLIIGGRRYQSQYRADAPKPTTRARDSPGATEEPMRAAASTTVEPSTSQLGKAE